VRWPPTQLPLWGAPHLPTPSPARPIQQRPPEVSHCQVSQELSAQHLTAHSSADSAGDWCKSWHWTPLALTGNEDAPVQIFLLPPQLVPEFEPPDPSGAMGHWVDWTSPRPLRSVGSTPCDTPGVRSHCRFRNRGTEYVSESGVERMSR
jgi:hypothetical protein